MSDPTIKINCMQTQGSITVVGAERYIIRSADKGVTWEKIDFGTTDGMPNQTFLNIAAINDITFFALAEQKAGGFAGIRQLWVSGNNGIGWNNLLIAGLYLTSKKNVMDVFLSGIEASSIVISDSNKIWRFDYSGTSNFGTIREYTSPVNEEITAIKYASPNEDSDIILATTANGTILRCATSNNLIKETKVIFNSNLLKNYPNPFNPTTTINFNLPNDGLAKVSVYNSKGELVKELINGQFKAGSHAVNFDGSNLNSGVYFYKLEADGKSIVNKMMLVK